MFLVIVILCVLIVCLLLIGKFRKLLKINVFLLVGLIVFAFSVVLFFVLSDYSTIDKCLDNGGRWDSSRQECEH